MFQLVVMHGGRWYDRLESCHVVKNSEVGRQPAGVNTEKVEKHAQKCMQQRGQEEQRRIPKCYKRAGGEREYGEVGSGGEKVVAVTGSRREGGR